MVIFHGSFAKSTRQLRPLPRSSRARYHQSLNHLLATVEEGAAMKRITVILSILAFALATTGLAMADIYAFSYSGNGQTGVGFLEATPEGGGQWSITGASGTIDGLAITGVDLCTYGTICRGIGGWSWDNVLYNPAVITPPNLGAAKLDQLGIMFTLAGGDYVNLFYVDDSDVCNGRGYCSVLGAADGTVLSFGVVNNATFAPVPEPSTLVLFGSGILGLAGILRKKVIG